MQEEKARVTVLLLLMLLAIGSLVYGQDEYMTCSRPVKSSRAGRYQLDLPCRGMDHGSESWCNLPGPDYPWHAVRRFVFENQGLMRRMYGEVRQLSVLRMEFSGENNYIEDARNFDEIFKPVTITPTIINLMATATSSNSELIGGVSRSINIHENSDEVGTGTGSEQSSSIEELEQLMTTIEFKTTTSTEDPNIMNSDIFINISSSNETMSTNGSNGGGGGGGVGVDGELPSTGSINISGGGGEESTDEIPTTTEGIIIITSSENNSSLLSSSSFTIPNPIVEPIDDNIEEKNRIEGQVLFQDFDRSSTSTTELPKIRGNRPGVNACPVKEEVVAPYWANNTRGEILALLNLYPFEQYIHWEKCTNEHRQMYCRDGCRCEQQYRLHRLLAFDPHNECRGIFSDWFRFPSCCVCKCYFDEFPPPERVSFNRSPRIIIQRINDDDMIGNSDEPDVNGVDDSHFYYKYSNSFRQPRK